MYGKYNSILSNISVTENQTKIISQRDIKSRSNSSISNFLKNKIQKFWRKRHKFHDNVSNYPTLPKRFPHFYYIPRKFQTLITWATPAHTGCTKYFIQGDRELEDV